MDFNETKRCALTADCQLNLRVFTSKSGERCRNYNSLHMCLPLVKGPKVMGQLASQLFHGQCVLFPHYPNYNEQIKGPEFISSVLFAFGICCCQCQDEIQRPVTIVKQAIIRLKNKTTHQRDSKNISVAKTTVGTFLKRRNAPVSSATPKDPEDTENNCVNDEEFFPW